MSGEAGVEHVLVLRMVERVSDDRERLHVFVFIGMQVGGPVGGGLRRVFSIVGFSCSCIHEYGRERVKEAFVYRQKKQGVNGVLIQAWSTMRKCACTLVR